MGDSNHGSLKRKRPNDSGEPPRPDNQDQWKQEMLERGGPGVEHNEIQRVCQRSDSQESTGGHTPINRDSKAGNGHGRLAVLPLELRDEIYRFVLLGAKDVPEIGSRCPLALLHSISNPIHEDLNAIRLHLDCKHTTFALTCTDETVGDDAHQWIYKRLTPELLIPYHGNGAAHTINVTVALAEDLPTLRYQILRHAVNISPDDNSDHTLQIIFSADDLLPISRCREHLQQSFAVAASIILAAYETLLDGKPTLLGTDQARAKFKSRRGLLARYLNLFATPRNDGSTLQAGPRRDDVLAYWKARGIDVELPLIFARFQSHGDRLNMVSLRARGASPQYTKWSLPHRD